MTEAGGERGQEESSAAWDAVEVDFRTVSSSPHNETPEMPVRQMSVGERRGEGRKATEAQSPG